MDDSINQDESKERTQEARAFLRKRLLRALSKINGSQVNFVMQENVKVSGIYSGCDNELSQLAIKDLQTAIGIQPFALLRTHDVINMSVTL